MKKILIALVVIVIIVLGISFIIPKAKMPTGDVVTQPGATVATSTATNQPVDKTKTVLGTSVNGEEIIAYHFGEGSDELLFVGGIHGGYEWNTALVAFQLMDYLKDHPEVVPSNVKVTVIPVLNPDGLKKVVGTSGRFEAKDVSASSEVQVSGRFNANTVDLNRNFDCDWKTNAVWQSKTVSGGKSVFSEPESAAIKNYVEAHTPKAAVVWYSSAGGVYASNCHDGVLPETAAILSTFSKASGYSAHQDFNFYEITGDMVNWLAKQQIPAISVLLTNHTDTEWNKNKSGIDALLKHYAK